MAINYNKLMEELDNCLGLESSATESVNRPKRAQVRSKALVGRKTLVNRKAFEGYDDLEVQLATKLDESPGFIGEDELIFTDESNPEDSNPGKEGLTDGELTDEGLFRESFRKLFERLTAEGSSIDEAREIIMNLVEESFAEYTGEDGDSEEDENEEIEEFDEEEIAEESTIVTPVKKVSPHTIETKSVGEDKEAVGDLDEDDDPEAAFEALSSKMLSRYQSLAEKTKPSKNSATEGKSGKKANIDELALARTSAEYGYSGKNLRKMVVEAIEKGVI